MLKDLIIEQSIQECRVLSEQAATALTENAACCPSGPEVFMGMIIEVVLLSIPELERNASLSR